MRDNALHYAVVYLDDVRRVKVFQEGGYNLEEYVTDIGWCLADDSAEWSDMADGMEDLCRLLNVHIANLRHDSTIKTGRIETSV